MSAIKYFVFSLVLTAVHSREKDKSSRKEGKLMNPGNVLTTPGSIPPQLDPSPTNKASSNIRTTSTEIFTINNLTLVNTWFTSGGAAVLIERIRVSLSVKKNILTQENQIKCSYSSTESVICVLTESCILPCNFTFRDDLVIHWIIVEGNTPVHSYYHGKDQFSKQDKRFSGRTSLFNDEISRGNASLKLTGVQVQDQNRFRCYISNGTNIDDSYIDMKVEARVRRVNIQQVDNRITCSSEGLYPEPQLTWSTSPPSKITLPDKPTVQKTEQQLYDISSSLTLPDHVTDLDLSCTVSAGRNRRRATLYKPSSITGSDSVTIPCTASNHSLKSLIWRFNHIQTILTKTDFIYTVSEEWRSLVKNLSESDSLTLQNLTSSQEGIYSCELSNEEETYVSNVILTIDERQGRLYIIGIVFGVLVILFIALIYIYRKRICKKFQKGNTNTNTPESPTHNTTLMELAPLQNSSPPQGSDPDLCVESDRDDQLRVDTEAL